VSAAATGRPGARVRSRARRLAVGLLGALVAGCATVPTSGPIEQGPVVDSAESTQFIRVIAAPPSQGAGPTEIVRGFLEASASLEQDHGIARRYLTEAASARWDPGAGTTVYSAASLQPTGQEDEVRAGIEVSGELLADGTLQISDPGERLSVTFTLAQVAEGGSTVPEWRIVDPPPGVLISASDLRRAYRLYETYFPSARSSVLVPDGRLIPVVGPSLPTTLAELVLDGPSEWLAPAVRTGAPQGTALALGAVPVRDGVARVELTEQALSATEAQRRDLAAQLTWTLTQLPDVVSIELLAGGEPYDVSGAPLQMDRETWRARSPDALSQGPTGEAVPPFYLLDSDSIVRVTSGSRTSIPITEEAGDSLTGLAVSLDQRHAAAVEEGGGALWLLPLDRATTVARVETDGASEISFDVDGRPWFLGDAQIRRLSLGGRVEPVEVPDGVGPITALQLARDGARVAVVAEGTVLVGILEERDSGPAIASLHRVDTVIGRARRLAWRDASTLDVLGTQTGGGRQVLRLTIGDGQVLPLGAPAQPVDLAAAPGGLTLVGTESSAVFANVGLQWRDQGSGQSVAYPG
jgi:hypothetical protein